MSLEEQYASAKQDYADLIRKADDAISDLKDASKYLSSSSYLSKTPEKAAFDPIEVVQVADTLISKINSLASEIQDVQYHPPTAIPNFQMEDHKLWKDDFADKLESELSTYLNSMGIPSKEFQDSIFNEDFDRKLQTLNDLLDLADVKTGARGFTYPNSMTTALKLDAQQKYQFDKQQISRDVTKLVTEWARQNYHMAIEKGIALETFQADFTYKYCTAFVEVYKNLVLASIERFKADIARYVEPIKAYIDAAQLPVEIAKINANVQKDNASLILEDQKQRIEESVKVFSSYIQQTIASFETQVKGLEAVAQHTAAFAGAASRSFISIQK